jgi:hypothetical protein
MVEGEKDVFLCCQLIEQGMVLKENADSTGLRAILQKVLSFELERAPHLQVRRTRLQDSGEQLQKNGLARTAWTQQQDDFSASQFEAGRSQQLQTGDANPEFLCLQERQSY